MGGLGLACRNILSVIRGLDPRIHHSSKRFLQRGWIAGSSPAMTNDITCPGRDAAFFMPLRRTGTPVFFFEQHATGTPALQRTAPQGLRAALRPGHERPHSPVNPAFTGSLLPSSSRK